MDKDGMVCHGGLADAWYFARGGGGRLTFLAAAVYRRSALPSAAQRPALRNTFPTTAYRLRVQLTTLYLTVRVLWRGTRLRGRAQFLVNLTYLYPTSPTLSAGSRAAGAISTNATVVTGVVF